VRLLGRVALPADGGRPGGLAVDRLAGALRLRRRRTDPLGQRPRRQRHPGRPTRRRLRPAGRGRLGRRLRRPVARQRPRRRLRLPGGPDRDRAALMLSGRSAPRPASFEPASDQRA
jgi:hypothetical protein